jgi:F0F1-type ATP synthase assembly protein I
MQSPKSNDKTTKQPNQAAFLLTMTILDTIWRTFVPTIGATFMGIGLDKMFATTPLLTAVLVILGFMLSAYLVVQQLRNVKSNQR